MAPEEHRILVVSQPKSGTYLCGNILEELGFHHTYIHISERKHEKYDPNNMQANRNTPQKFTQKSQPQKSINLIGAGAFGMTHIQRNKQIDNTVKGFKIIFLERPFEDAKKSWDRFIKNSKRPAQNPKMTKKYFDNLTTWKKLPNAYTLTFDQMIGDDVSAIDALQTWLWGSIRYDSKTVIANAKGKDSLTKSNIR